ncbi:hypothetical protein ANCDUO_12386 [Ancylostoma duodenale]|uniref:Uncharacterized protein n=1 Tax=Ancylostoma duodenale TaxID=51022 RepID=A0A0C2CLJ8_9BILA|nr:hypothetical protein ANCDUO_12386 [Ancylostoma duodenale]
MVCDHSSLSLDDGFLAIKLARSQSSGFCCLVIPGAESLIFQTQVTGMTTPVKAVDFMWTTL